VNINETELDYGTLNLSTSDAIRTTALTGAGLLSVSNTGNSPARLMIGGTDATSNGSPAWTLNCSPDTTGTVGLDQYVHRFVKPGGNLVDAEALCSDLDKELAASVAVGASVEFRLQLNMPTGTTGFGQRSSTVTITAVEQ
jgi:hypothetical protein